MKVDFFHVEVGHYGTAELLPLCIYAHGCLFLLAIHNITAASLPDFPDYGEGPRS